MDDDSFLSLRNRAIVLMFLDTGLRLSELANIQLSEIDFDRGMIKVMGKGSKERFVAVGKKAQKAILRYLLKRDDRHSCLWVTEERQPLRARGIQMVIKRARRRAGITGVRCSPHIFRHTFALNFLRGGGNPRELQCLLGHTSIDMSMRYVAALGAVDALRAHERASPVDRMELR